MYIADFHIHSHYSYATSKTCTLEYLDLWARRKGIRIVGTGDFTHPAWRAELKEKLISAERSLRFDCRDLIELAIDEREDSIYIPAHIWTPHFSVFGEFSGFETPRECFGDMTSYVYAMETGLSYRGIEEAIRTGIGLCSLALNLKCCERYL